MTRNRVLIIGKQGALIERKKANFTEYVSAWSYDEESGTWGQGHYFPAYPDTAKEQAKALEKALNHFKENYL